MKADQLILCTSGAPQLSLHIKKLQKLQEPGWLLYCCQILTYTGKKVRVCPFLLQSLKAFAHAQCSAGIK